MGLGSIVEAVAASTSIKKVLTTQLASVEEVAFLTADSWMRASRLPEICVREEALVSAAQLVRKREIDSNAQLNFEIGKALHRQLQEEILPQIGVLLGEWECTRCGLHYGVRKPWLEADRYAIRRPEVCQCENRTFRFHEYSLEDTEYRITGHPDGLLSIPGLPGLGILEAKSISPNGAWEVANVPKLDHVLQAHIYMWLLDLQWAKIFYWDKGTFGLAGLIEHDVERDEDTILAIKSTLTTLWAGVRSGIIPPTRVCASREAPRALKCEVCGPCFDSAADSPEAE